VTFFITVRTHSPLHMFRQLQYLAPRYLTSTNLIASSFSRRCRLAPVSYGPLSPPCMGKADLHTPLSSARALITGFSVFRDDLLRRHVLQVVQSALQGRLQKHLPPRPSPQKKASCPCPIR
jgi:hypothetical protein